MRCLPVPPFLVGRILLLDPGGVVKHRAEQVLRGVGHVDRTPESFCHQAREQPAVVNMHVGQDNRVKPGRINGGRDPVSFPVRSLLEEATIDEDFSAGRLEAIT